MLKITLFKNITIHIQNTKIPNSLYTRVREWGILNSSMIILLGNHRNIVNNIWGNQEQNPLDKFPQT